VDERNQIRIGIAEKFEDNYRMVMERVILFPWVGGNNLLECRVVDAGVGYS